MSIIDCPIAKKEHIELHARMPTWGIGSDWGESCQLKKLIGLQRREGKIYIHERAPANSCMPANLLADVGIGYKNVSDLHAQVEGTGLKKKKAEFKKKKET